MHRLALFVLTLGLIACASIPTPIPPTATPPLEVTIYPEAEALPGDVLLVYTREGGFAYSNTTLTIYKDGRAEETYVSNPNTKPAPIQKTLSANDLAAIQAALNDPALAALPFGSGSGCADCYVYTVTARTANGIVSMQADEAELSKGNLGLFQTLINQLQATVQ